MALVACGNITAASPKDPTAAAVEVAKKALARATVKAAKANGELDYAEDAVAPQIASLEASKDVLDVAKDKEERLVAWLDANKDVQAKTEDLVTAKKAAAHCR